MAEPTEFELLLQQALSAHRAQDPRARAHLAAAWGKARKRVDELFPLAQAFEAVGDITGLRDVEHCLAAMDRKRPRVALAHGRVLRMLGEHRSALPILRRAAKRGPKIVDTHIALTTVLLDLGDVKDALAAGRHGLMRHPDNILLRLQTLRAQAALDLAALDLDEVDALVTAAPGRAAVHQLRLTVLRDLGLAQRGHRAVDAFAAGCPKVCDAVMEHAGFDLLAGDPRAAVARLSIALHEDPPHLARLTRLGQAAATAGDDDTVEAVLARLDRLPASAERFAVTGQLLRKIKDPEQALTAYHASLAEDPGQAALWAQAIDLMTLLGRGADALEWFYTAPEAVRTRPDVVVAAAQAAHGSGQAKVGIDLLEGCTVADHGAVLRNLTDALCRVGRSAEAQRRLQSWTPSRRRDQATKALCHATVARSGYDYLAVEQYALEALAADPNRVQAWWQLAHIRMVLCDPDGAMEAWKRMIAINKGRGNRTMKHQGTLLWHKAEELKLDPVSTAALAAAWREGPEVLRDVAAGALNAGKDLIGPALSYLVALRQLGVFKMAPPGETPIPRVIHQYWEGPVPDDLRRALDVVAPLNAGFMHKLWGPDEARAFVAEVGGKDALRAYLLARHAAERADLFRLVLLYAQGGIYLDADDLCHAPIEALLPAGAKTVLFQEYHGALANNFIATVPGSEILATALQSAVSETISGAATSIWLRTGPGLVSRSFSANLARSGASPDPGLFVFNQSDVSRCLVNCAPFSYKLDHRHWMKSEAER